MTDRASVEISKRYIGSISQSVIYCEMVNIPTEIGQLVKLQCLSMSDNEITIVPSQISSLTDLINLTLQRNKIINVPSEISHLTNLKNLFLHYNN